MSHATTRLFSLALCLTGVFAPGPAVAQTYVDNFEAASINPFWSQTLGPGSITLSTEQSHSGMQSVKLQKPVSASNQEISLYHNFSEIKRGRVSVWMYDTRPNHMYAFLGVTNTTLGSNQLGHGFHEGTFDWDQNVYHYSAYGAAGDGFTSVPRTIGWHHLELSVGGTGATYRIDGTTVASFAGDFALNNTFLHIQGAPSDSGAFYFDDFEFEDSTVPEPASALLMLPAYGLLIAVRRSGILRARASTS